MTTLHTQTPQTTVEADPSLPTLRIVRDFAAPPEAVFRAWTHKDLVERWLGPADTPMGITEWDCTTGGRYRYTASREGEVSPPSTARFHEVRPAERIVQTFTWEGMPDGVSLETVTFEDLGDGRTRVSAVSVVDTMEARDAMVASGMEAGIVEGYAALDALLAE